MLSLARSSVTFNSTSPSITSTTNWSETETLATIAFGIIAIVASAATIWQGQRMWRLRHQRHSPRNLEDTSPSGQHAETLVLPLTRSFFFPDEPSPSIDIEAGMKPARTVLLSSSRTIQTPAPVQLQVFQQSHLESSKTEVVLEPETRHPLTSILHLSSPITPTTARPSDGNISSASEEEHQLHGGFAHHGPR